MAVPRNTLAILANEPTHVTFGDYALDATPLTIGELPAILRHAEPLFNVLDRVKTIEDAVALFLDHGDALIEITAIAARLPAEQVRALTPDAAAELFLALLEVNADFFVRRMGRAHERARQVAEIITGALQGAANSTGQTPLPG